MADLQAIVALARRIYDAPYEVFSRFLLAQPRPLEGEEALAHLEQGWGLSCAEKARLMAFLLTRQGVRNTLLGGAFEMWVGGVNVAKLKGNGFDPPNEAHIAKSFAPEWKTSPYETPLHMVHWANYFEADGDVHLVDCVGEVAAFRHFSGADVTRLLDSPKKSFVDYLPPLRIYYHRFSEHLLKLVEEKQRTDHDYLLGRFLGSGMFATSQAVVNLKWWWREKALEEDQRRMPELSLKTTGGEISLQLLENPAEVAAVLGGSARPAFLEGLDRAWPAMCRAIDRIFDKPPHVRLVVTQAQKPFVSYSSNRIWDA